MFGHFVWLSAALFGLALAGCSAEPVDSAGAAQNAAPAPPTPPRTPRAAEPVFVEKLDADEEPLPDVEPVQLPDEVAKRIDEVVLQYDLTEGDDVEAFRAMEALMEEARQQRWSHPRRAEPVLSWLYEIAAHTPQKSPEAFERQLAKLQRWQEAFPDSSAPLVAAASVNNAWAWQIRGSGFANTVDEESWRPFRLKALAAAELLDKAEQKPVVDAHLYVLRLEIGRVQSADRDQIDEWFEKGRAIDPECLPLYREMAITLLPRWHGLPGEVEALADKLYDELGDETGPAAYATMAQYHQRFDRYGVIQGAYDRDKLHHAAKYAAARWPQSMGMNELASLVAWIQHDRRLARQTRDALAAGNHVPGWLQQPFSRAVFEKLCEPHPRYALGDRTLWDYFPIGRLRFLRSGEQVITFTGMGPVRLLDVESQSLVGAMELPVDRALALAKHPSRDQIAFAALVSGASSMMVVDFESGAEPTILYEAGLGPFREISYSADGNRLLAADGDVISVWDISSAEVVEQYPAKGVTELVLGSDEKQIVDRSGKIYVAETKTWKRLEDPSQSYHWSAVAGFLDEHTLVGQADTLKIPAKHLITTWDLKSDTHQDLFEVPHNFHEMALSPSKKLLAAGRMGRGDFGVYVYDLESKQQRLAVDPLPGITQIDFSPDERWLAVACSDGGVRVFDLTKVEASSEPAAQGE